MALKKNPLYIQPDAKGCGPTCLRIIANTTIKAFRYNKLEHFLKLPEKEVVYWG